MAQVIAIDHFLFALVCTPFSTCASVLNVFFMLCLCKPAAGVGVRQPMSMLLCAVLGNSTLQQLTAVITVILSFCSSPDWLSVLTVSINLQAYCSSFSINAWIGIFYYLKIVPQHWKVFMWIKKNIKAIIVAGFLLDQTLLMTALSMGMASYLTPSSLNETTMIGKTVLNTRLYTVSTRMFLVYIICPTYTLLISWGKTFFYLRRHMRRMEESSGSSARSQQKNHMRVTITGIVQTALFVPASLYTLIMALLYTTLYETMDYNKHITVTVTSVFSLASISCLGYSQSVFRIRVIALLKRVRKAFGSVDQI